MGCNSPRLHPNCHCRERSTAPSGIASRIRQLLEVAMTRSFEKIPAELRSLRQWVCWRLEKRDGKNTKVPYHPRGHKADASDSATWSGFAEVVAACANGKRFNGIGFVFAKGGDY